MQKQDVKKRVKNFNEVALGLTDQEAQREAKGCLGCKKASCIEGCPVGIDIPAFIKLIKEKKYSEAIEKIKEKNNLPAICGRVCPQEDQCEKMCILFKKGKAIKIGYLERFVSDCQMQNKSKSKQDKAAKKKERVAIVGSGPAGLTCSADLAKMGYDVTLFESLHKPGGVLVYGIPEFRLPKSIVEYEVDYVRSLGVTVEPNVIIGRTAGLDDLRREGFKAFFIGTGAGLPYFLGIDSENLNGVYSANEFLTRTNLMKAYLFPEYDTPITKGKKVGVIGGGNVAMDSARCAKRLGAEEVTIIYRRTEKEMPARIEEIENAKEEGINFKLLTNPVKIFGKDGWVDEVECMENSLGEPDASGRRRPVPIEGSNFKIKLDTLICAIGQGPNPLLLSTIPELKLTKRGNIEADDKGITSMADVFAGGDIVTGAATVISAMGAAKKAAVAINEYLEKK
ncbi:MAG: NADPH-dependent glutamate synthase [Candidatus Omnitrophica bacterium]|nr:NADPH-dependent glutamate synthase [Candidatus Omnitrophota bacterium]